MNFDFIFVVLVYRNINDLKEFFLHYSVKNSKVIVVNSFYDEESETAIKNIAFYNKADFISVPNKGYGFGNNRGCEYALKKYNFKYLVISNADIEIQKLQIQMLDGCDGKIVAPRLINKVGRNQNPSNPYSSSKLHLFLMKTAFLYNLRRMFVLFSIESRLKKIYFQITYAFTKKNKIFAPHGAFTIFSSSALKKLFPVYDENIFLFCEEPHLGNLAMKNNIPIVYKPQIEIYHKEDGSMRIASINTFEKTKESFLKFYQRWYG